MRGWSCSAFNGGGGISKPGTWYSCGCSCLEKKGFGSESKAGRAGGWLWEMLTLLSNTLKLLLASWPAASSFLAIMDSSSQMISWMISKTLGSQGTSTSSGSTMGLTMQPCLVSFLWYSSRRWSASWFRVFSCLRVCFWMCCSFSLVLYSVPQTTQKMVSSTSLASHSWLTFSGQAGAGGRSVGGRRTTVTGWAMNWGCRQGCPGGQSGCWYCGQRIGGSLLKGIGWPGAGGATKLCWMQFGGWVQNCVALEPLRKMGCWLAMMGGWLRMRGCWTLDAQGCLCSETCMLQSLNKRNKYAHGASWQNRWQMSSLVSSLGEGDVDG